MAIFADNANRGNAMPARQPGGATGPFSSLPQRLDSTPEGRRLMKRLDLQAGEIVGRQILTVGAMQSAATVYAEMLDQKAHFIHEAQQIVSSVQTPAIKEEMARSSNSAYAELDIELLTIARTGCRGFTGVLERSLDTSRSGSLLDKFRR